MILRKAKSSDIAQIEALLSSTGLTINGVEELLGAFVVAESGESIVGVGGVEYRANCALLRSVAVAQDHRNRGVASMICDRLETDAARIGCSSIYLLTETAERFFANRGYLATERANAPPEIACSEQFSSICPASAVFMRRAAQQVAAVDRCSASLHIGN